MRTCGEIHYLEQPGIAYLRWIYVEEGLQGKGIGTKCMCSLKKYLYDKGIRKLDTDTALTNTGAQHFYEKNKFNIVLGCLQQRLGALPKGMRIKVT